MLWIITERKIISALRKKRYRKSEGSGRFVMPDGSVEYRGGNLSDYVRQNYGLGKDQFKHELFIEEFTGSNWLTRVFKTLYRQLRGAYFHHFISDIKDAVERCIKKGYIEPTNRPEGMFIKETEEGRNLLSLFYYPKKILEWNPALKLLMFFIIIIILLVLVQKGSNVSIKQGDVEVHIESIKK